MKLNLKVLMFALFISAPSIASAQNLPSQDTCYDVYRDAVSRINVAYLNCLDVHNNECTDVSICIGPNCEEILKACSVLISVCEGQRLHDLADALQNMIQCPSDVPTIDPTVPTTDPIVPGPFHSAPNMHLDLEIMSFSLDVSI